MKINLILQPETWCWHISEIKMYWNGYWQYFKLKVNEIGKFVVSAYNEISIRHTGLEPFNSIFKEMNSVFYKVSKIIRSVEWWQLYWRQNSEIDWYSYEIKWWFKGLTTFW